MLLISTVRATAPSPGKRFHPGVRCRILVHRVDGLTGEEFIGLRPLLAHYNRVQWPLTHQPNYFPHEVPDLRHGGLIGALARVIRPGIPALSTSTT